MEDGQIGKCIKEWEEKIRDIGKDEGRKRGVGEQKRARERKKTSSLEKGL